MKAAVFYNEANENAVKIAEQVGLFLIGNSVEVYYINTPAENVKFKIANINQVYGIVDFCVIVGGDGTIIRYAKLAALNGVSVIGINAGRLGFLADLELNEIDKLKNYFDGNYQIEERLMLKVSVIENDVVVKTNYCINDAVLIRDAKSHMIDFYVNINGERFDYRGDGMIFSTPTGSTGYSLSAGGPVTSPDAKAIIMTPVCSHSLMSRPVVFSENTVLKSGIIEHYGCDSYLCFDWEDRTKLSENNTVIVEAAKETLKLIRINASSFYKRLNNKFMRG